jgi:hypothetical protein
VMEQIAPLIMHNEAMDKFSRWNPFLTFERNQLTDAL